MAGSRKTAAVALLDYSGAPIKTYSFTNCWVKSVEVNALKAGAAEQATEKFVIFQLSQYSGGTSLVSE